MVTARNGDSFISASLSEKDVAHRFREQFSPNIQGIEKVYLPFYEFELLITFDDNRPPMNATYWCDAVLSTCKMLPDDYAEPRLVARRGGTLLPLDNTVEDARSKVRQHVLQKLPRDVERRGVLYNLTLEYRGTFYVPYWVAHFQGARPGVFDFIVFDSRTGEPDTVSKEIVDRGFLLLDEQDCSPPPWF